jgi:hypothetical protein
VVQIDGQPQPLQIDLCEVCDKGLVAELEQVLALRGYVPNEAQPRRRQRRAGHLPKATCLLCTAQFAVGSSLRSHYVAVHQQTEADAKGTARLWCPECKMGYETVQGISMHLMRAHGMADDAERRAVVGSAATSRKPRRRAS